MSLPYPKFDPVAIHLGPLPLRWYSLSYIAGIALGWWYAGYLLTRTGLWSRPTAASAPTTASLSGDAKAAGALPISPNPGGPPLTKLQLDDLIFWVAAGVMLGGRCFYLIFYEPALLVQPWTPMGADWPAGIAKTVIGWLPFPPALELWNGGMSFHGGIFGVTVAGVLYARKFGLSAIKIGDLFSSVAPIGLFLGRIANFVNGELYGRPWNGPWAMVFPADPDQLPRHPSQLYEAATEGLILFLIVNIAAWGFKLLRRPGAVMGLFLAGYALSRITVENFRMPDIQLPNFPLGLTMGMMLSTPMLALGIFFFVRALRRPEAPAIAIEPPPAPNDHAAATADGAESAANTAKADLDPNAVPAA